MMARRGGEPAGLTTGDGMPGCAPVAGTGGSVPGRIPAEDTDPVTPLVRAVGLGTIG